MGLNFSVNLLLQALVYNDIFTSYGIGQVQLWAFTSYNIH